MSLISFSDNFSQISLYKKCQLQLQHICKLELYNANKTACNEKTKLIFKQKQDLLGTTFCGGMIFGRECSKSSFYQFNKWNCIQYIFISRGAVLLMGQEYLKQDSNDILKQILFFKTINVDIKYKNLNKSNIVFFSLNLDILPYLKIYITDPIFLFHISRCLSDLVSQ